MPSAAGLRPLLLAGLLLAAAAALAGAQGLGTGLSVEDLRRQGWSAQQLALREFLLCRWDAANTAENDPYARANRRCRDTAARQLGMADLEARYERITRANGRQPARDPATGCRLEPTRPGELQRIVLDANGRPDCP
jgi:hypothetical protein